MKQQYLVEFLGSMSLIIVVVGSGVMGQQLAPGDPAMILLVNSLVTGAGLYVLITALAPLSGAHLNPLVSWSQGLDAKTASCYTLAQTLGAIGGVFLTHLMFGLPLWQLASQSRSEPRLYLSELLASCALITLIGLVGKRSAEKLPLVVALFIMAGYWCTSSSAFANPAVTLSRVFTDSFTGIHWQSVPGFVLAQALGAWLARWICGKLDP